MNRPGFSFVEESVLVFIPWEGAGAIRQLRQAIEVLEDCDGSV